MESRSALRSPTAPACTRSRLPLTLCHDLLADVAAPGAAISTAAPAPAAAVKGSNTFLGSHLASTIVVAGRIVRFRGNFR